jgi:hypothetical protein
LRLAGGLVAASTGLGPVELDPGNYFGKLTDRLEGLVPRPGRTLKRAGAGAR